MADPQQTTTPPAPNFVGPQVMQILPEEPVQPQRPPTVPVLGIYSRQPGTQTYIGPPPDRPAGFVGPQQPKTVDTTPKTESVMQTLNKPLLPTEAIGHDLDDFLVGPFDWFHRTAIDAAMGMTSPLGLAITAGTGGLSSLSDIATSAGGKAAVKAIQAGASAYFAGASGKAAAEQIPEAKAAYDRGDWYGMFKAGGRTLVDGVFAAAAAAHATDSAIKSAKLNFGGPATEPPPGAKAEPVGAARGPDGELLSSEAGVLNLPNPKNALSELNRRWIDANAPVQEMEEGKNVPRTQSAYQQMQQFAGHVGKIELKKAELRDILLPVANNKLMPDLDRYLELQRHQELFARPGLGSTYTTPGGMDEPAVNSALNTMRTTMGPAKMAQLDTAATQLRAWSDKTLAEYHDAGMISDAAYQSILANNQHYAPLLRLAYVADELNKMPAGGRTFNVSKQGVVYPIQGSDEAIIPPTEGFLRNAYKMTIAAEKNKVGLRIANMSQQPEFQGIITKLGPNDSPGRGEGIVTAFNNGVKETYAVPKPVADAIGGMNGQDMDALTGIVAKMNRGLVLGSTRFYPPFLLGTTLRPIQTAILRAPELGAGEYTPKNYAQGLAAAVFGGKWYDAYLKSGAAFSGFFERDKNIHESLGRITEPQWKRVARNLTPWDMMRTVAQTFEQAPRIGYLRKGVEAGIPLETAGSMTRNLLDYGRMGSDMRKLNMWSPFINARLQGLLSAGEAVKNYPIHSALALTAMVGLPELYTYEHNVTNYPQVWKDIRQREKDNNFLFIHSDRKDADGNYLDVTKIPKEMIGRITANPLEHFLEWHRATNPESFWSALKSALVNTTSDASPIRFAENGKFSGRVLAEALPPTLRAAVIEPLANKNLFTGRKIETDKMRGGDTGPGASPGERWTTATPTWVVKTGQFLGISPRMLQNFAETQFGGVGRLAAGDIPQGKDELTERSSLGAMKRVFSGAQGGGNDEAFSKRVDEAAEQVANQNMRAERAAQRLYAETLNADPDKRNAIVLQAVQSGKIDADGFKQFMKDVEVGAKGLTPIERRLDSMPAEARAIALMNELNQVPAGQERAMYFKHFMDIGVANEAVAKEMNKLMAAQTQTPPGAK